jgi:hypothetical protein
LKVTDLNLLYNNLSLASICTGHCKFNFLHLGLAIFQFKKFGENELEFVAISYMHPMEAA